MAHQSWLREQLTGRSLVFLPVTSTGSPASRWFPQPRVMSSEWLIAEPSKAIILSKRLPSDPLPCPQRPPAPLQLTRAALCSLLSTLSP